jgi:glyoxalase family protein
MDSEDALAGVHHITLVASKAERTVRFYTQTLGLTFVKKTVNFDQPTSYHLYFGDKVGTPGTLVTFFEWGNVAPGRPGVGTTHHMALTVDTFEGLLKWKTWLQHGHHLVAGPHDHQAYRSIIVMDPDGVIVEIATREPGWEGIGKVESQFLPQHDALSTQTWGEPIEEITPDMRLGKLHHIAALCSDIERTDAFYQDVLCFPLLRKTMADVECTPRWYWSAGQGRPGTSIAYSTVNPPIQGHIGHGLTHHFAFEVVSDDSQRYWQERLMEKGIQVTPILDRKYFRSIYFNDPDGHILEIATRDPGFLVDQPVERLGKDLALPDWLAPDKANIEAELSPISL